MLDLENRLQQSALANSRVLTGVFMVCRVAVVSCAFVMALGLGCKSGDGGDGTSTGSEGGACNEDGTCDAGLDCRSGLCVDLTVYTDVIQGLDSGITSDSGSTEDLVSNGCSTNCVKMVTVPAGPFWQGCNDATDTECTSDELPYHEVNVPIFEIDKYEVTVGLYRECVDRGGCSVPSPIYGNCNWYEIGWDMHPITCITWDQARDYCAWAGKRLCSESEWEKAARGTDGRKYPWGNEPATCDYAVMLEGRGGCGTERSWAVGSKPAGASPCGALDMSGNVDEWVEDDWHTSYSGAPTDGSAWKDDEGAYKSVARGGDYFTRADNMDATDRGRYYSSSAGETTGVRCCRSK